MVKLENMMFAFQFKFGLDCFALKFAEFFVFNMEFIV